MEARDLRDLEMKDISNVFFNRVTGMSNMRYFKSQEIAHNHCNEERKTNCALRNDCGMESIASDVNLKKQ